MRLRIVDCGLRIDNGRSSRGWTPTSLIRNPQSAIRNWFCCFLAACDVPDLAAAVKIRCWADPYVPGQTQLTVETVSRPRYDPSRTERDLEVVVPKTHAGRALADSLVAALKKRFGIPNSAPSA